MKNIHIIGAPSTFGQRKLGVNFGPDALRYAGLVERLKNIGHSVEDKGNIAVPAVDVEKFKGKQEGLRNLNEIIEVSENLSNAVSSSIKNQAFPLIIGGDEGYFLTSSPI